MGGSGGVTIHNHYNITQTIQGSVQSEHDLISAVTDGVRSTGSQNWQQNLTATRGR